jgi:cytidylate kinase
LQDQADALRIFLYAPRNAKVRRLGAGGMSNAEAEELVDTVDNERAAFVEKYFHREWPNRPIYHAMLNTASGDETVVHTIVELKNALEQGTE